MMKNIFRNTAFILWMASLGTPVFAQNKEVSLDSITSYFAAQLQVFPQEKIYVHTDKTDYLGGEDVRFRIYLVDALSHHPDTTSRYVYAELINPLDSLISRVKIRPEEEAYHGHISLPEELPEGEYELRFYTRFMEGLGDDYFFKKKIRVGDPLSALYRTESAFRYDNDKKQIKIDLRWVDTENKEPIKPDKIRIMNEKGELKEVKPDDDNSVKITKNIAKDAGKNFVYLEYDYQGKFHKEFLPLSPSEEDFDVSFFPEGGHFPAGTQSHIAFKSLNSNGLGEDITGVLFNEAGDTINTFKSQHRGMGFFLLYANAGEKYYAVCKNKKNVEKRFELPPATGNTISLQVNNLKDRINVLLSHSPDISALPDNLYLIMHYGGYVLYAEPWDKTKEFIIVKKNIFPSGVIQILLVDSRSNPISERMFFNINEADLARISFAADKSDYGKREQIKAQIGFTDMENRPLTGNFSLSVTDDRDVVPDSCVNILSSLLLTSELKGHIESPAYYFRGRNVVTLSHLDILMQTQGWRRYDVSSILKGKLERPKSLIELGPEISGMVKGGILMNRPATNYPVSIISLQNGLFGQISTDDKGQFVFNMPEMPDSTRFVVQANTKKGGSGVELLLNPETYPESRYSLPASPPGDRKAFEDYLGKADRKFIQDNGMHTIYLQEVEVTARRKSKAGKSPYTSVFNTIVSSEEIEKRRPHSVFDILRTIGGVMITGEKVSIRGGGTPLVLIDGFETDADYLGNLVIDDVDEVEVVKDGQAAIFGTRGGNGVIMITTKRGFESALRSSVKYNIKPVVPLGYQTPKEFYSPRYETKEEKENNTPDLRTTIYWNPHVKITDGKADVNFYSADASTTYSVVIEGICSDGKLIYAKETISREK